MHDAQDQSQASWRQLESEWNQVCERWNDGTTRQFESQFWSPLVSETRVYHHALEHLMDALQVALALGER